MQKNGGDDLLKKERSMSFVILGLEALLRRLPSNHTARESVLDLLSRHYAGYRGEKSLDRYISHLSLPDHYFIFQDLRLPLFDDVHFQIDTLLLTPAYFLIYESKNLVGDLYFERKQLIRKIDDTVDVYQNPIIQIQNQQYHLQWFLEKYSYPILPSNAYVVVTNSKSRIMPNPDYPEVQEKVIRLPALRLSLEYTDDKLVNKVLSSEQMERIANLLIASHTPEMPNLLEKFQIKKEELLTGLYCQDCERLSIRRQERSWICWSCQSKGNEKAILQALVDYRLLMGKRVSNKEFRRFIGEESKDVVSRILRRQHLPTSGGRKNRKYEITREFLEGWVSRFSN